MLCLLDCRGLQVQPLFYRHARHVIHVSGVGITPLPEEEKPKFIKALIDDALSKGSQIVNGRGGLSDRTLVAPTVLFPVSPGMRIYSEEQFGPLVPVVEWTNEQEL